VNGSTELAEVLGPTRSFGTRFVASWPWCCCAGGCKDRSDAHFSLRCIAKLERALR
jgi:hypothetical protein